jgi:prepilin-type N-terminal cleavage/methylation domain-containing protein
MPEMKRGFTLIELLVVIAILAVLAVAVVLVLNPAELLKQSRDSTRLSDMATLNSALSLYYTDVLGANTSAWPSAGNYCTVAASSTGGWAGWSSTCANVATTTGVNGTSSTVGWVPINFSLISSGSPLTKEPIDPNNGVASCLGSGSINNASCGYAFVASSTAGIYKLETLMESSKFGYGGSSDVVSKDSGVSTSTYEIGSNLMFVSY